jgi:hypothetical protein
MDALAEDLCISALIITRKSKQQAMAFKVTLTGAFFFFVFM